MQYQLNGHSDDQIKSGLRPVLRRVLENFEIRFETKFKDLVLLAWVETLSNIPDNYLLVTCVYVSSVCTHLPTPFQFLEMYREKLRQAEDLKRLNQKSIQSGKDNSLEAQKDKLIARLSLKCRSEIMEGCIGRDFDERIHNQRHAEFFEDMRKMSLETLQDLDMQLPPFGKKVTWSKSLLT